MSNINNLNNLCDRLDHLVDQADDLMARLEQSRLRLEILQAKLKAARGAAEAGYYEARVDRTFMQEAFTDAFGDEPDDVDVWEFHASQDPDITVPVKDFNRAAGWAVEGGE